MRHNPFYKPTRFDAPITNRAPIEIKSLAFDHAKPKLAIALVALLGAALTRRLLG